MIELYVEEYCSNCPDFEAEVDKDCYENGVYVKRITRISCKNMDKCREIMKYLKEQVK